MFCVRPSAQGLRAAAASEAGGMGFAVAATGLAERRPRGCAGGAAGSGGGLMVVRGGVRNGCEGKGLPTFNAGAAGAAVVLTAFVT